MLIAACHYVECHHVKCHNARCHYAECHYAECRGANFYAIDIGNIVGVNISLA